MDYRYFPEPDLKPLVLTDEYIAERSVKEIPIDRRKKYLEEYKFLDDDARILSAEKDISDYFESLTELSKDPKKSCSYITTVLLALMKESLEDVNFSSLKFETKELARVIELTNKDELSSTNSKIVVEEMFLNGGKADEIVDRLGLRQKNDTEALAKIVDEVLANSPSQIEQYKSGKVNLFGYFVGECMKASKGQGNPKIFSELIKNKIG